MFLQLDVKDKYPSTSFYPSFQSLKFVCRLEGAEHINKLICLDKDSKCTCGCGPAS